MAKSKRTKGQYGQIVKGQKDNMARKLENTKAVIRYGQK